MSMPKVKSSDAVVTPFARVLFNTFGRTEGRTDVWRAQGFESVDAWFLAVRKKAEEDDYDQDFVVDSTRQNYMKEECVHLMERQKAAAKTEKEEAAAGKKTKRKRQKGGN